jgi:hypothetical protein
MCVVSPQEFYQISDCIVFKKYIITLIERLKCDDDFIDWLIDWLVFNPNFSSISAILWSDNFVTFVLFDLPIEAKYVGNTLFSNFDSYL